MAIAKMNKLKIISLQNNKEAILQAIQGIQSVELIDLSAEYEQEQTINPDKKNVIDEQIKTLENQYDDFQDQLHFLQGYLPKQSMVKKLREPIQSLTLQEIEADSAKVNHDEVIGKVKELRTRLVKTTQISQRLQEEEAFLRKWQNLSFIPSQTVENQFVRILAGSIPQTNSDDFIRNVRESDKLFFEEVYQTRDEYGLSVTFDTQDRTAVKQLLEDNHFFILDYPFENLPKEQLKVLNNQQESLKQEQKEIKDELSQMKEEEQTLKLIIETIYARMQRLRGELLLIDEPNLFILEGWMEGKKVNWVREVMAQELNPNDFALLVEEVKEEEYDKVPIVLENNKYISPFENITVMYSLPKYNEIDPTPFLMPFYFVFFGMMLADAGYGLIMLIATVVAQKFFSLNKGMKKNMQFFQLLSYSTIIWGLIYGSFFGLELPIVPLSIMDDVNTILLISVAFGVIQILLGLGIKTYLYLRDGDLYGAVSEGIGWLTIFAGIILLVVANLVMPNETLSTVGGVVAIAGAVAIIVASALATKNKALGVGVGFYNLYGITGYIGDIVSYTRLMALGVSGGSIALAFNMIIDFLPPAARFTVGILLFVLLHSVNIGLSGLSAYVHGARLMFVEFFGKFYEGGGKGLNPLKTSEEYIELKNNIEA